MKLRHVHHRKFDKLICAISIICLAVVLVLVLVLKDIFQVLVLVLVLGVRSLSISLSLGGQVQEVLVLVLGGQVLVLVLVLGVRSLSLSWCLGVRSLLTSLPEGLLAENGRSERTYGTPYPLDSGWEKERQKSSGVSHGPAQCLWRGAT